MDDATTNEQPVVGLVEWLACLFMDKALQCEAVPISSTVAGRCNGRSRSFGTHEPAAQIIIVVRNKASDSNAVASCRKVQHTSFVFIICPPFS